MDRIVIRKGGFREGYFNVYKVSKGSEMFLEYFKKKSDAEKFVKNYRKGLIKSRYGF